MNTLLLRIIFLLYKKHTIKMFKLYRRIKFNENEKYTKFSESDFKIFFKSEEKDLLLNFVKSDLNISKIFFNEIIKLTKNIISKKKDDFEPSQYEKLAALEEILNNKISNKDIFNEFWNSNFQEFNNTIKKLFQEKA
jgi:hypothetical protein